VRGAPGNTVNHPTSYWVPRHAHRSFVETVDMVSGVGYDRAAAAGPEASRFHHLRRVVSNLGVFDFNGPDHQMRAVSLHPGITPEEVQENTSFEVHGLDKAEATRLPAQRELELIRTVIDPKSLRDKEIRA